MLPSYRYYRHNYRCRFVAITEYYARTISQSEGELENIVGRRADEEL